MLHKVLHDLQQVVTLLSVHKKSRVQQGQEILTFHEHTQPELTNLPAATSNSLRLLMAPKSIPNPRPLILWMQQEEFTKNNRPAANTVKYFLQSHAKATHEKNSISLSVKRTHSRSPLILCQDKSRLSTSVKKLPSHT